LAQVVSGIGAGGVGSEVGRGRREEQFMVKDPYF